MHSKYARNIGGGSARWGREAASVPGGARGGRRAAKDATWCWCDGQLAVMDSCRSVLGRFGRFPPESEPPTVGPASYFPRLRPPRPGEVHVRRARPAVRHIPRPAGSPGGIGRAGPPAPPRGPRDPRLLPHQRRARLFRRPTAFNLLGLDRGCGTSTTSPTTTPGTARTPGCSARGTGRRPSSQRRGRSTTTCCGTPRCRPSSPRRRRPARRSRRSSSTRRPRRSARELGYQLILPPHALRPRLDSKIVTTRLGNEAGAASVPNVLAGSTHGATLVRVADRRRAGHRPGGPDALRRLRQDDVLHRLRGRLGPARRRDRRAARRRS